ncbi:MAG: bifunctional 4-hydroxy-2-oxoglutarate aldolase/2-dehydro-3-deoxy-phosphogluconate aldolase [Promethearchaeota archaeon]|nr:MAG: bifunctional 4-hydroxy-2-oxoglutarate aldolase/2-dehydro-3-deoxy-phosphogluconate aldolase [Candidatus Lokiarchaeota archaeon]
MDVIKKIENLKIIPVAVIEDSNNAIPLGEALNDAGLPVVEITFRTEAAAKSISLVKKEFPEMLVGAGTVLKIEHVKAAIEAGSEFIVTPGFNPTVVDYCVDNKIPIVPGLNSPSFIEWGMERGLYHFKFFPADLSGGVKMIQLLSGPYPDVKFMPTGGINNQTLVDYLKLKNVFACGGSWIVKKNLISEKKFDEIKSKTRDALKLINNI